MHPDQKSKAAQGIRLFRAFLKLDAAADETKDALVALGPAGSVEMKSLLADHLSSLRATVASMYATPRPEGIAVDKAGETWFLVHADTDAPVFEGTIVEQDDD